jgi:hypothetical protein
MSAVQAEHVPHVRRQQSAYYQLTACDSRHGRAPSRDTRNTRETAAQVNGGARGHLPL